MFGIGEAEFLIILAFGFMIFGPDKLPGMGRTIGRALRQFRQAQEGFTEVVQTEVMDPLQQAMGDPLDTGTRAKRRSTAEERAAALAQDADIDDDGAAEAAAPARKETFAERKARLAAEKKQREQEAAEAAAADDADLPTVEDAPADAEPANEPESTPDTSASALYAIGGTSKFAAAKAQQASAKVEQEAPEDADGPVADGESAAAPIDPDTHGKEGEGE